MPPASGSTGCLKGTDRPVLTPQDPTGSVPSRVWLPTRCRKEFMVL
jgi:hypothetical protein